MLVDIPFIPATEAVVQQWIKNLKDSGKTDEEIKELNLGPDYFTPVNLTTSDTGLEDNTGIYGLKLKKTYSENFIEPGVRISRYEQFLPVVLSETKKTDHLDLFERTEELMSKSYGYVLSFKDFMLLIGEQLNQSKRKFAVSFYYTSYSKNMSRKNGRIHHPNHEKLNISEGDKLIGFHIVEVLDKNDFVFPQGEKFKLWEALALCNNLPLKDQVVYIDRIREKGIVDTIKKNLS